MQMTKMFKFMLSISMFLIIPYLEGCAAAAVSGAATGVTMASDRRTAGTIVDDKSIEIKAVQAMSKNPILWKTSHLSVTSYNNALLITGQTLNEDLKQQAEAILLGIPKVTKIYNELAVKPPISFAKRSKDSWITTQIKAKMLGTKSFNPLRVKVITEDSIVYLLGLTTPEEEMIATDIARAIAGVEKVVQIFEHS